MNVMKFMALFNKQCHKSEFSKERKKQPKTKRKSMWCNSSTVVKK